MRGSSERLQKVHSEEPPTRAMTPEESAALLKRSSSLGSEAIRAQKLFITEFEQAVAAGQIHTAAERAQYELFKNKANSRSKSGEQLATMLTKTAHSLPCGPSAQVLACIDSTLTCPATALEAGVEHCMNSAHMPLPMACVLTVPISMCCCACVRA